MGDEYRLMWSVLFSSVGLGYVIYGRKQKRVMALVSGLGLMLCPYLVSNVLVLVLVPLCVIFLALPYFVRI